MADEQRQPLLEQMEHVAADHGLDTHHTAIASIAVSLKRIADALHGDDLNIGMKHALVAIADRMPSQ